MSLVLFGMVKRYLNAFMSKEVIHSNLLQWKRICFTEIILPSHKSKTFFKSLISSPKQIFQFVNNCSWPQVYSKCIWTN